MMDSHLIKTMTHMRKLSFHLPVLAILQTLVAVGLGAQGKPYAEVIPASATTQRGLFDVHRVGPKLHFEIPDSLLGREMIVMSRYGQVQEGLSQVGANMAPNITVKWERRGDHVHLRATSHANTADSLSARSIAVVAQNFAPVLQSFRSPREDRAAAASST
jgi:hypothetical protein